MAQAAESIPSQAPGPHPKRWTILAVLCLSLLVVVLDNTVLGVAIPSITASLSASTADIQWAINAYSLVLAGLLMTTGALADRFGRKRSLLIGVAAFTAGSAVAAFSETALQLILARAGMGIGAAFLMPGTLAVLMYLFDEEERPKAIAAWSAVASLGMALGPVIGGTLLTHFWWGSVFLLNLPIGAFALVAIAAMVPESRDPSGRKTDLPGVLLSIVLAVGLVYAVISVPESGWASIGVLVPFTIGLLALVAFVWWERRIAEPMLDTTLFRNPKFTGAVVTGALLAFAMGGSLFLFTQYLQFVLGYTPLQAGFATVPMAVTVLASTSFSARVIGWIGGPLTLVGGLTVLGAGLFALSLVHSDSGYLPTLVGLVLIGGGVGIATPASTSALMGSVPSGRGGIASGLTSTLQEFGNALGVAILGSVMSAHFSAQLPAFLPDNVKHSMGLALAAATRAPNAAAMVQAVKDAFVSGTSVSLVCGAVAAVVAGIAAWALIRREPAGSTDEPKTELIWPLVEWTGPATVTPLPRETAERLGQRLQTEGFQPLPDADTGALIGTRLWRLRGGYVEYLALRPDGLAHAVRAEAAFDYRQPADHGPVVEYRSGYATNALDWLLATSHAASTRHRPYANKPTAEPPGVGYWPKRP